MTPEAEARQTIDRMLEASGWQMQNYAERETDASFAEDQIRTVIQTFKDALSTDLFPSRSIVPKTLIFAKDDSHVEDIVHIVRDVFAQGDDFCQKITYTSDRPEDLIRQFRTQFNPRIVRGIQLSKSVWAYSLYIRYCVKSHAISDILYLKVYISIYAWR